MLHHWDLVLFHAVNGWCGNWALDRIVFYEQGNQLLEGGLILTCYWWFWFATPDSRRDENRRTIIAALIGVFLALVASRVLATMLPFRMRPMYVAGIGYHAPSLPQPMNMEHWSSFPSDTAAYFLGLAYGIYRLSRPAGIVLLLYAATWICLPRLYLGIHYPSDLLAGGILGLVVVGGSMAALGGEGRLADRLTHRILAQERQRPRLFYAAAFVLSFEMSMTFDDVRDLMRALLHGARVAGYASLREEDVMLLLLGVVAASAMVMWAAWYAIRRRQQPPVQRSAGPILQPKAGPPVRSHAPYQRP